MIMRLGNWLLRLLSLSLMLIIFSQGSIAFASEAISKDSSSLNSNFETSIQNNSNIVVANNESTLTAPVTDPNFNVMRKKEILNSKAITIVVGILIAASLVPYLTWIVLRRM